MKLTVCAHTLQPDACWMRCGLWGEPYMHAHSTWSTSKNVCNFMPNNVMVFSIVVPNRSMRDSLNS